MKANITAPNANELISLLKSEIKDALGDMDKFVTVGIHEDKNARKDGFTNAQVGAANHFGTARIHARPWLDVGVEKGSQKYIQIIENAVKSSEPLDMALERVGVVAAGEVQLYIRQLKTPPNAESTKRAKRKRDKSKKNKPIEGFDNPLIDTGQMRQSVSYKVTPVKPSEGIG